MRLYDRDGRKAERLVLGLTLSDMASTMEKAASMPNALTDGT